MAVTLRTFTDPFYDMNVELDGQEYIFSFAYNQRENAWYFSLSLANGTRLAAGVKVVCDVPLLRKFRDSRLPAGVLVAHSNTQDRSPPGLDELGEDRRVTLTYASLSELA